VRGFEGFPGCWRLQRSPAAAEEDGRKGKKRRTARPRGRSPVDYNRSTWAVFELEPIAILNSTGIVCFLTLSKTFFTNDPTKHFQICTECRADVLCVLNALLT
jgi:hypothetical protein